MGRRGLRIGLIHVAAAALLSICGCTSREAQPQFIFGLAQVETIDVLIDYSASSRASAVVRGIVRDSCTRIDSVRQSLDGRVFLLTLTTRRPISADECRDAEVPFEATVPLVVRGLRAGEYVVASGNITTTFQLRQAEAAPQL